MRHAHVYVAMTLVCAPFSVRAQDEIRVGVISPLGQDPRSIGAAHEESIRLAGEKLRIGSGCAGGGLPIRFIYASDDGDPNRAVAQATRLVNQEHVVALLGPVDTESTKKVLTAELRVPVLSALSTVPSLTALRDDWFFRVTIDDAERVKKLFTVLEEQGQGDLERSVPEPRIVIYDSSSDYGRELRAAVLQRLHEDPEGGIRWSELVGANLGTRAARETVRTGVGLFKDGTDKLGEEPRSIFILGTSQKAALIAQGILSWQAKEHPGSQRPQFFFIGDDSDLRRGAPNGSITIGEPTLSSDDSRAVADLRQALATRQIVGRNELVVTAYEAACFVLPAAIHRAWEDNRGSVDAEFRDRVRKALETGESGSLEPGRQIRVAGGRMDGAPDFLVYRIDATFEPLQKRRPRAYLEVKSSSALDFGFLEGEVKITAEPHETTSTPETWIENEDTHERIDPRVEPRGSLLDIEFYPTRPGRYLVRSSIGTDPPSVKSTIAPRVTYPLAILSGFIGALIVGYGRMPKGGRISRLSVGLGTLTGFLVAALHFHRDLLPFASGLPSFGDSYIAAAAWAGFAGGFGGPGMLLMLFGKFPPSAGPDASAQDRNPSPTPVAVENKKIA